VRFCTVKASARSLPADGLAAHAVDGLDDKVFEEGRALCPRVISTSTN
jgi:hypothetical protein